MNLHFASFLGFRLIQIDEINPGETLYVAYPTKSMPCLLMPWRLQEPGHQQAWHWPSEPEYSVCNIRRVKHEWPIWPSSLTFGPENGVWHIHHIMGFIYAKYEANPSHGHGAMDQDTVPTILTDVEKYEQGNGFSAPHPSNTEKSSNVISSSLSHWGRDKIAAISQTTFWNSFSWMKMYEFHSRFHWSLFLRFELTIFQHWLR